MDRMAEERVQGTCQSRGTQPWAHIPDGLAPWGLQNRHLHWGLQVPHL